MQKISAFERKETPFTSTARANKRKKRRREKTSSTAKYHASELSRRIDLPSAIDPDKVSAHLAKGVLELTLPKAAPPKKIEVKAA